MVLSVIHSAARGSLQIVVAVDSVSEHCPGKLGQTGWRRAALRSAANCIQPRLTA